MFMTYEEAIVECQNELNTLLNEFDTWVSRNPSKLIVAASKDHPNYTNSLEFMNKKQRIKMVKYKLLKLNEGLNIYKNTLTKM